jgi:hypothetical protein
VSTLDAAAPGENLSGLIEKAHAVALKAAQLKRGFAGAHRLAHAAQVREALTRAELTEALHAALAGRAELEARLRVQALATYRATRRPRRLRRHGRPSRMLDRLLARLGSFGQAAVIARSRVWQGTGQPLFDLRHMAAYARRRANPAVAPRAFLDQAWYLAQNPDVARSGAAPLTHYLVAGAREGRDPHPLFSEAWYGREHAQVLAATGLTALEHYARVGAAQGFDPHPLFDVGYYLGQGPALAAGEAAAAHYLREGAQRRLRPHLLFDPAWYAAQAGPSVASPDLVHYLTSGWREGLSPHPLFDPGWYLVQYPEVAELGVEPLTHFLLTGADEGKNPSPWFDTAHYVEARGAGRPSGLNPLVDYLRGGAWAVAEARPGFPTAAYLATQPDLVRAGLTPLEHWARRAAT